MARLNVNDARCEALFASGLQRSDAPTAEAVADAIRRTVRRLGTRGCAGQMAQEFGDHPQAAVDRMRWARQLIGELSDPPGRRQLPGAVVVPARLGPVPAPGHRAPPAGAVATGIEEPQHAGRVLAAADPVRRLGKQLKETGRGHHGRPPCRVVDLKALLRPPGRADGQAQAPVAENRVEPACGSRSALF